MRRLGTATTIRREVSGGRSTGICGCLGCCSICTILTGKNKSKMKNAKICNDSCRGKKCMSRSKRYKYAACINLQLDVRMWPIGVYIYVCNSMCVKQHQRMYMRLCSIVPALRCRFSWNAVSSHPRRLYTFDFLIYVMSFTPCMNASLNVCLCVCFDLKSGSLLSCIVYTWNVFTLWTVGECDRSRHCTVWPVMQTSRFMHGSARVQGRVRPPLLPTSSFSLSACLPLSLSLPVSVSLSLSLSTTLKRSSQGLSAW